MLSLCIKKRKRCSMPLGFTDIRHLKVDVRIEVVAPLIYYVHISTGKAVNCRMVAGDLYFHIYSNIETIGYEV